MLSPHRPSRTRLPSHDTNCARVRVDATITGHDPRGAAAVIMGHPVKHNGVVDMEKMVPLVDLGQPTAAELQK